MRKISDSVIKYITDCNKLFKGDDGGPLILSETQKKIEIAIAFCVCPHVAISGPVGYGKSTAVALGLLIRAITKPWHWHIIGGTQAKGDNLGGYVIQHLFDNPALTAQLKVSGSLEQLKRERKRTHLTFTSGGEIQVISADYKNEKRVGEILMGMHGDGVYLEDSALCSDYLYAYARRVPKSFFAEGGNTFKRNHFYKTMNDNKKNIYKIQFDYKTGLKEGRYTAEYIDTQRGLPFFDVFYECKFPSAGAIDSRGYQRLLNDDEIDKLWVKKIEFNNYDKKILSVDPALGGDTTVFLVRQNQTARVDKTEKTPKITTIEGLIHEYLSADGFTADHVFVDSIGIGAGISQHLEEQHVFINALKWGCAPSEESIDAAKNKNHIGFFNLRAECFWKLKEWIERGGKVEYNKNLEEQLKIIKYKINSTSKIQILDKAEIKMELGYSPDELDALAGSFAAVEYTQARIDDKIIENETAQKIDREINYDEDFNFDMKNL